MKQPQFSTKHLHKGLRLVRAMRRAAIDDEENRTIGPGDQALEELDEHRSVDATFLSSSFGGRPDNGLACKVFHPPRRYVASHRYMARLVIRKARATTAGLSPFPPLAHSVPPSRLPVWRDPVCERHPFPFGAVYIRCCTLCQSGQETALCCDAITFALEHGEQPLRAYGYWLYPSGMRRMRCLFVASCSTQDCSNNPNPGRRITSAKDPRAANLKNKNRT